MNSHVIDFYKNRQNQQVVALHEHPEGDFECWVQQAPGLLKGWMELAQLNLADRIEFVTAFWSMRFPYSPHVQRVIQRFFASVEDLGVYLVKREREPDFAAHLVYSMKNQKHFYHGVPPVTKEKIQEVYHALKLRLPEDYISLMKIHNGFAKDTEEGIIPLHKVEEETYRMQTELMSGLYRMTFEDEPLDPRCLIPFYKREERSFYQCFHREWYPDREMGTVGLSLRAREEGCILTKTAFPSFLGWLKFYMETEDV